MGAVEFFPEAEDVREGEKGHFVSCPIISCIFFSISVHDKLERDCAVLKHEESADVMLEMAILINLWQTVWASDQAIPACALTYHGCPMDSNAIDAQLGSRTFGRAAETRIRPTMMA